MMNSQNEVITLRPGGHPKAVYFTLVQGVEAFNRNDFYAAHDFWEEVWREVSGDMRTFFQGLIHAAVGLYHWSNGNALGAHNQLEKAIEKLRGYPDVFLGIQVGRLCEDLQPFLAYLQPIVKDKALCDQFHPMHYSLSYPGLEWDVTTMRVAFGLGDSSHEDILR